MRHVVKFATFVLVFLCQIVATASALGLDPEGIEGQGGATSISGVVTDTAGGVIPGATVVIASETTGTKFEAVTNPTGAFSVPSLPVGTYTVTVTLQGFKTAVITNVRAQLGIPSAVKAVLEVGGIAETITVTGASAELINTQTATVAATLNMDQIAQIPMPTREVLGRARRSSRRRPPTATRTTTSIRAAGWGSCRSASTGSDLNAPSQPFRLRWPVQPAKAGAGRPSRTTVQVFDSDPSTRMIADAIRRHSPSSRTSSFRPARVSV